jgi:hypothetical protein
VTPSSWYVDRSFSDGTFCVTKYRGEGATDNAHHHCNLRRLGGSIYYFGASGSPALSQNRSNRIQYLPSYRASGRRMRVRISAYPMAGSVGPLALGPLHSEDVEESISRKHVELGKGMAERLSNRMRICRAPTVWSLKNFDCCDGGLVCLLHNSAILRPCASTVVPSSWIHARRDPRPGTVRSSCRTADALAGPKGLRAGGGLLAGCEALSVRLP